jgi:hypothetical protein
MWHGLFDRLSVDGLSEEGQRGLFGELLVLERILFSALPLDRAVASWCGPDRRHQDFEVQGIAIEVKTSIAKRPTRLRIANEKQLDDGTLDRLFLAGVRLDRSGKGISLNELVERVSDLTRSKPDVRIEFENKLKEAGYLKVHEPFYRENRYVVKAINLYEVGGDFPRLIEANLPPGIVDVTYCVIAENLGPFSVSPEVVATALVRAHGGS